MELYNRQYMGVCIWNGNQIFMFVMEIDASKVENKRLLGDEMVLLVRVKSNVLKMTKVARL